MIKVEFQIKDKLLTNSVKTIDSHLEKKITLKHCLTVYTSIDINSIENETKKLLDENRGFFYNSVIQNKRLINFT